MKKKKKKLKGFQGGVQDHEVELISSTRGHHHFQQPGVLDKADTSAAGGD